MQALCRRHVTASVATQRIACALRSRPRRFAIYKTLGSPSSDTDWTLEHQVKVSPAAARMQPAFEALRKDRKKAISKAEFVELCPTVQTEICDRLFSLFETHPREGLISYTELCGYVLLSGGRGTAEEKVESLFPLCDHSKTNEVSLGDLVEGFRMLYYARFQDVDYVEFKAGQLLDELAAQDETSRREEEPTEAAKVTESPKAAASGVAGDSAAFVDDKADATAKAAAQEEVLARKLTLRQYVQWVRSDNPQVAELRQLLRTEDEAVGFGAKEKFESWPIPSKAKFEKIKVTQPVVELDGDEMTRIVWQMVKDKLLFPFLDMEIDYYDLSITYRDETDDAVMHDAVKAINKHNVAIKCPTITPSEARVMEFNLKEKWESPSRKLPRLLGGTFFRAPIVIENIPRYVPGWEKPIIVGRHAHGDEYGAKQLVCDVPGRFKLVFEPDGGGDIQEVEVYRFPSASGTASGGAMLGMCNTRESVVTFARCCFEYALAQGLPLYMSTKGTVLKEYDGIFVDVFDDVYEHSYKRLFEAKGLWYQHMALRDMLTQALRSSGGFVWACKNQDGELVSDVVAQGHGSPGLLTSILCCPDGKTVLAEAAHGTFTSQYRDHQRGVKTSINPIAIIFAWTKGLAHRAQLDDNSRLADFAQALEEACCTCVRNGQMSKDLAVRVHRLSLEEAAEVSDGRWLHTEELIAAFANELRLALCKPRLPLHHAQDAPFPK
eukprot:TRINITY_DN24733_c0_g1_i1.p1 TRINITY_DN24733_c0_g1~~TRINITY_DN24733_c0_g1_i1.p1  ORF type:complete len:745 (+),score=168.24 TRINITY_DN24733_c0_g1_i1:72-2237(+)